MPPMYDPEQVRPMWEELARLGVAPLTSADEVDQALSKPGTALCVVNSVCGCAAGSCRPGVALALQNDTIPDHLFTVFAGMDREAVERARQHMPEIAPSSPCLALFKDGKPIFVLERRHIERMSPVDIAKALVETFNRECSGKGPSVPREVFESVDHVDTCGSTIDLYQGD
jgi:putative YphP/YqiW family bacilliredoxin